MGRAHTFYSVRGKGLGSVYGTGTGQIRSAAHEGTAVGLPVDERDSTIIQRAGGIFQGQGPGGRAKVGDQEQPAWTRAQTIGLFPARTPSSQLPAPGIEIVLLKYSRRE